MNAKDWVFLGVLIGWVICGIVACIIYEQAKRKARAKREGREYKEDAAEQSPTVNELYACTDKLLLLMLQKQDALYDKRQNMTCEELGSKNGVQFAKEYEQFSIAVDLLADVREYMRQAVETKNQ